MLIEDYIAAWNEKYGDTVIPDEVRCVRSGCEKSGDDLIIPETLLCDIACPDHDVYWIAFPREPKGWPI